MNFYMNYFLKLLFLFSIAQNLCANYTKILNNFNQLPDGYKLVILDYSETKLNYIINLIHFREALKAGNNAYKYFENLYLSQLKELNKIDTEVCESKEFYYGKMRIIIRDIDFLGDDFEKLQEIDSLLSYYFFNIKSNL